MIGPQTKQVRRLAPFAAVVLLASQIAAASPPAGRYRANAGPDVASALVLASDGRFTYFLAAGSLDERAEGTWQAVGNRLRLTTLPAPVAPVFSAGPISTVKTPLTVHVTTPNGRGLAAVDLRIGFDTGDDVEGYTQEYGWSLPGGEARTARWIEFAVPMFALRSQRFVLDLAKGNSFNFLLTPNDIGTIDFAGVPIDIQPGRLIVHRGTHPLIFEAVTP